MRKTSRVQDESSTTPNTRPETLNMPATFLASLTSPVSHLRTRRTSPKAPLPIRANASKSAFVRRLRPSRIVDRHCKAIYKMAQPSRSGEFWEPLKIPMLWSPGLVHTVGQEHGADPNHYQTFEGGDISTQIAHSVGSRLFSARGINVRSGGCDRRNRSALRAHPARVETERMLSWVQQLLREIRERELFLIPTRVIHEN